ncbi:mitochondrial carrier [Neoconidiobolus thromboides FSU 785]|nr:mitochondrial carrier [Neoconidiobolus thromboides FSU 785]
MNGDNSYQKNDSEKVNPYRPYVDFSVSNPASLNPYLPSGNIDPQSALTFALPTQEKHDHWDIITYALMKYVTTAMASPFEVAHTLIQVQHLPTIENEDIGTKPAYQLSDLEGGLWSTMNCIIKHPSEGVYWIYNMLHLFLQPSIEGTLNDTFDLYDDTIPLVHLDSAGPNIATMMVSNLAAGLLLNPLDLIRTRLIVQSSDPKVAKYNGPFHALVTILQEEGLEALYWGEDILPSALYHILSPLMQQCAPLIIDRLFHISPLDSPFIYGLFELALSTIELMIVLPLDTIRKRLQAQPRYKSTANKNFIGCIRTRNAPYANALDCAYRIVTEEAKPEPKRQLIGVTTYYQTHGFGALYRGFAFHSTTIICTSLVSSFIGIKGDPEW